MIWLFVYRILTIIVVPFALLRLLVKGSAYRQRLNERLALIKPPARDKPIIWVHCVSVGEFFAAKPLLKLLHDAGRYQLVITTTTPTGSKAVLDADIDGIWHYYFPFDVHFIIRRFLNRLQPKLCVTIDTELWLNLAYELHQRGVPYIVANARLSEQALRKYLRFAGFSRFLIAHLSLIAAQNDNSAQRFQALGAKRVSVFGNIKFDLDNTLDVERLAALETIINDRRVILFASTHEDEEVQILNTFRAHQSQLADCLLVICPRHQERFNAVEALIKATGLSYLKRSDNRACQAQTQILLGDSLGELLMMYHLAELCFIGGSLVERGGHNMLEAAAFKKPILFGQSVYNFSEIAQQLLTCHGAIQVVDRLMLFDHLVRLYHHPEQGEQLGDNAYAFFSANKGASQRLAQHIEKLLE